VIRHQCPGQALAVQFAQSRTQALNKILFSHICGRHPMPFQALSYYAVTPTEDMQSPAARTQYRLYQ